MATNGINGTEVPAAVKLLSAADILAAHDLETLDVEMPEWGGTVRIRMLSADEAIKFGDDINDPKRKKQGLARLIARCAIDADGNQLFTEAQVSDLLKKGLRPLRRLQDSCLEHNGLGEKARKAEEELAKNV